MESVKVLYRYVDNNNFENIFDASTLILKEYTVLKETPKGYNILYYTKVKKFVLKGGEGKRFAYESKALALKSYIKRKEMQIAINKASIKRAEYGLILAKKTTDLC